MSLLRVLVTVLALGLFDRVVLVSRADVTPHPRPGLYHTRQAINARSAPPKVAGSQTDATATTLHPSTPIRRSIEAGQVHVFRIAVVSGQYLRVVVDQQGIDVAAVLLAPSGKPIIESDLPNGNTGPEPLTIAADVSGDYLVEVRPSDSNSKTGPYEITLLAARVPTESDRARARAEAALREAIRWSFQPTAGSRQDVIRRLEDALRVFRSDNDDPMTYVALNTAGLIHHGFGELGQALDCYREALSLAHGAGHSVNEAFILNNIGGVYDILGEPHKALGYYDRAISILRELGNTRQVANTLNNMGVIYYNLSRLQKALEYYNQSLELKRGVTDIRGTAVTLENLALVYIELGEHLRALEYLQEALALRRTAKDVRGEAISLHTIGFAYSASGDVARAVEYYNQAMPLRRKVGDRRGEAITLYETGRTRLASNEPEMALEALQEALKIQQSLEDRRGQALSLGQMANACNVLRRPAEAIAHAGESLALFRAVEDERGEAMALRSMAEAERGLGDVAKAIQHVEGALSRIEGMRASWRSQEQRSSFLATKEGAYKFYIALLMGAHRQSPSEGYAARALKVNERARARSLLEMLGEAGSDIRQGVDPALLDRERIIAETLDFKAGKLVRLLGQQNTQEAAALKKEIGRLEDEYQQVLGEIRANSPAYAAITQPRPLDVDEIQQQLDEDTLLLSFSLDKDRSYVWAVSNNSVTSRELPGSKEIDDAARHVYDLLTARSVSVRGETQLQRRARVVETDAKLPEAASQLSEIVLRPIATELRKKRIVVVADGMLQYVPFAMLPLPKEGGSTKKDQGGGMKEEAGRVNQIHPPSRILDPLILEHEVISLPSASALAVLRQGLVGRQPAPNAVAVLADPVFSTSDERVRASLGKQRISSPVRGQAPQGRPTTRILEHIADHSGGPRMVIPRLPFTKQEAEQILALAPANTSFKATGFSANVETATSGALGSYRYVHFATHGYLDTENPGLSAIVLSMIDERGKSRDGLLTANEIYNLKLGAELVVLSACQTGLGKEYKGEGLVGLTRGFMYAGAARVLVSLWNVNDRATSDLMAAFYRKMLKENQRPAEALRAAQVEMWKQKQWESPYYWAAFVLQGEWK